MASPRFLLPYLLVGAAPSLMAMPQAIDESMWTTSTTPYQHLIKTIGIGGDIVVTNHRHQTFSTSGITIYERDAMAGTWSHLQDIPTPPGNGGTYSTDFEGGRIYRGNRGIGTTSIFARAASGLFELEETVQHSGSTNIGLSVHARAGWLFAQGNTDVEIFERGPAGTMVHRQTLVFGSSTAPIGDMMHSQGDWLFVSQRATREIIFVKQDAGTGLYAEHSRAPFPGGDFYSNKHSMTGSGDRFFYGSSGDSTVLEFRWDEPSNAWNLADVLTEPIPPPNQNSSTLRGFGTSIALEGDRLAVAKDSPYVGGSSIFEYDHATDSWERTRILRSREFPSGYRSDSALAMRDGKVAVATFDYDDVHRNLEVTVWDLNDDDNVDFMRDSTAISTPYCDPAVINFSYVPGRLGAYQPSGPGSGSMRLIAQHLPANTFGFAIASAGSAFFPTPGGSRGNLCLAPGASLGRFVNDVTNSGAGGTISTDVNLASIPVANGTPVILLPGDVWYFQLWYRDGPTSNFTNAIEVTIP